MPENIAKPPTVERQAEMINAAMADAIREVINQNVQAKMVGDDSHLLLTFTFVVNPELYSYLGNLKEDEWPDPMVRYRHLCEKDTDLLPGQNSIAAVTKYREFEGETI